MTQSHYLIVVVVAALQNGGSPGLEEVDQAVFFGDAAGPVTGKVALVRVRLADSVEGIAAACVDQAVNIIQDFRIGLLPVAVGLPCNIRKLQACAGARVIFVGLFLLAH